MAPTAEEAIRQASIEKLPTHYRPLVAGGGHGRWDEPEKGQESRLLAPLNGTSLIGSSVQNVLEAGLHRPIVVINHDHFNDLAHHLRENVHHDLTIVEQPSVTGGVGALESAQNHWSTGATHILLTMADMPLWHPTTLRELLHQAVEHEADVMVAVLEPKSCEHLSERMTGWGRVICEDGRVEVHHPREGNRPDLFRDMPVEKQPLIYPSLMVFKVEFLQEAMWRVEPCEAYGNERLAAHLPKIASDCGYRVEIMPVHPPEQALGVNSLPDLHFAKQVLQSGGHVPAFA